MGKVMTTKSSDGGTISIERHDKGYTVTTVRGFSETPEQRLARIHGSKSSGYYVSGNPRQRTRANSKAAAIRSSF